VDTSLPVSVDHSQLVFRFFRLLCRQTSSCVEQSTDVPRATASALARLAAPSDSDFRLSRSITASFAAIRPTMSASFSLMGGKMYDRDAYRLRDRDWD
jgi:hypothetical protein